MRQMQESTSRVTGWVAPGSLNNQPEMAAALSKQPLNNRENRLSSLSLHSVCAAGLGFNQHSR
jgi:hypothetical protein